MEKRSLTSFSLPSSPPPILAGQDAASNSEECSPTLCGNSLSEESLPCSWRSNHEDTSPWSSDPFKEVWHLQWQNNCLLEQSFSLSQVCNVLPANIGILLDNDLLKHLGNFLVKPRTHFLLFSFGFFNGSSSFFFSFPPPLLVRAPPPLWEEGERAGSRSPCLWWAPPIAA